MSIASLGRTLRGAVAGGPRGALEKAARTVALRTEAVMRRHCRTLRQVCVPVPECVRVQLDPGPCPPTVWRLTSGPLTRRDALAQGPDFSRRGQGRRSCALADRPVPDSGAGAGGPKRAPTCVAAAGGGSCCAPWTPSPPAGRSSSRCEPWPGRAPSSPCTGLGVGLARCRPGALRVDLGGPLGPSQVSSWPAFVPPRAQNLEM